MKGTAILAALCLCLCSCTPMQGQRSTTIDLSARAQTLEGWGVSLCWWANMCGRWQDEAALDTLLTWLASDEELGYTLFRYNIPGGDAPDCLAETPHHFGRRGGKGLRALMEAIAPEKGSYDWSADEPQRRVMLRLRELQPAAQFEAFSNSPPWWMTVSGCVGGAIVATDDNLREDCYEAFARYLIDVCTVYRDSFGIEFLTLEPFNEPMTDYWYAHGGQEGCHFSVGAQLRLMEVLAPMLEASSLSTRLAASDETSVKQSIRDLQAYMKAGQLPWQWNTHSYEATDSARIALRALAKEAGIRLWQSESGAGGRGLHGNLKMAQRLFDDMRLLRPTAWMDWQYVEERGDQWSLVSNSGWRSDTFRRHKSYWVRWQVSHFIRPGYTFIATDNPQLLAAVSPEGKELVLVLLNTEHRGSMEHTLTLSGLSTARGVKAWRTAWQEDGAESTDFALSNDRLTVQLPPLSIMTFVIPL